MVKKSSFVQIITLGMLSILAATARADPPGNDIFSGALPVVGGDSDLLDTSEATTDSDDAQLNASCGAPATDASVWYTLEGNDTPIVVDVSQSDYSAGVLVGVGSQGDLLAVACGPGTVGFYAFAGTTYYILAFDDQFDGGGNGGLLEISFDEILTPTLDISINRFGRVDARTGIATISGTYTCSNGDFIGVSAYARQPVGRFVIQGSGYFSDFGTCDEEPRSWSAEVFPENGKFAGGKSLTVTFSYSCGPYTCGESYAEQTVHLRGGRK